MGKRKVIVSTPTIDTNVYASGDHLGDVKELANAFDDSGGTLEIESLVILDKAKQDSALDILLFDESPTVASSDNAALDISDAEMVDKCIGQISVAAADYVDLNANSIACIKNIGLVLDALATKKNLYYILRSAGTPTYTSTSDLTLKFGLAQD